MNFSKILNVCLLLNQAILLMCLVHLYECSENKALKIVKLTHHNITTYGNRNLTVTCQADLSHRKNESSLVFTTNARIFLTLLTIPREGKPIHRVQSFLHCLDPNRTDCYSDFNFDFSCIEDQMNKSYFQDKQGRRHDYTVEVACQVDDTDVCSYRWTTKYPLDCYDITNITVLQGPRLNEPCFNYQTQETMECGLNQYCKGYCICQPNYEIVDRKCILRKKENHFQPLVNTSFTTSATITDDLKNNKDPEIEDNSTIVVSNSKNAFKSIVIFLLVIAILLCIALGIVIIWSRHYRLLMLQMNGN